LEQGLFVVFDHVYRVRRDQVKRFVVHVKIHLDASDLALG